MEAVGDPGSARTFCGQAGRALSDGQTTAVRSRIHLVSEPTRTTTSRAPGGRAGVPADYRAASICLFRGEVRDRTAPLTETVRAVCCSWGEAGPVMRTRLTSRVVLRRRRASEEFLLSRLHVCGGERFIRGEDLSMGSGGQGRDVTSVNTKRRWRDVSQCAARQETKVRHSAAMSSRASVGCIDMSHLILQGDPSRNSCCSIPTNTPCERSRGIPRLQRRRSLQS